MHARLRALILSGELAAGAPISESSLALRLEVSRTPLREALRMLASEGLVHARPHRQTRVSAVSPVDLEELYAARVALESLGALLTVPELTSDELVAMTACLREMEDFAARRDVHGWEGPHERFHGLLVTHAGERIRAMTSTLSDHSGRYRKMYLQEPRAWGSAAAEHSAIADACVARDAKLAATRLARHLARTALTLLAVIAPEHDPRQVRGALAQYGVES